MVRGGAEEWTVRLRIEPDMGQGWVTRLDPESDSATCNPDDGRSVKIKYE